MKILVVFVVLAAFITEVKDKKVPNYFSLISIIVYILSAELETLMDVGHYENSFFVLGIGILVSFLGFLGLGVCKLLATILLLLNLDEQQFILESIGRLVILSGASIFLMRSFQLCLSRKEQQYSRKISTSKMPAVSFILLAWILLILR